MRAAKKQITSELVALKVLIDLKNEISPGGVAQWSTPLPRLAQCGAGAQLRVELQMQGPWLNKIR